jgi:hypothetical protein
MCHACLSKDVTQNIEISCNCSNSLCSMCDMMEHSGVGLPESDDCIPYSTPLTSPSSSSGYESCHSFFGMFQHRY